MIRTRPFSLDQVLLRSQWAGPILVVTTIRTIWVPFVWLSTIWGCRTSGGGGGGIGQEEGFLRMVSGLSVADSPSTMETLRQQRANRLTQALSSPSGKLTYCPEVTLPEPVDWTAIALQANAIQSLSKQLRDAKANAIVLDGSLTALQTLSNEQESVLGSFPGPVPIIYYSSSLMESLLLPREANKGIEGSKVVESGQDDTTVLIEQLNEISNAGADGFLVPVVVGGAGGVGEPEQEMGSMDDAILGGTKWAQICQAAMACGIQPIPELVVPSQAMVGDHCHVAVCQWVDQVCTTLGFDPVALVVTINSSSNNNDNTDNLGSNSDMDNHVDPPLQRTNGTIELSVANLPFVRLNQNVVGDETTRTKTIKTRIPILGAMQSPAGDGRLQGESNRFKEAGYFAGAVLKQTCLPRGLQLFERSGRGSNNNPLQQQLPARNKNNNQLTVLELLGPFWSSCLNDLKSTKSKSFSFRAKNHMEKSVATQWGNYQKSVIESGALGDPRDSHSVVDESSGEYKGF